MDSNIAIARAINELECADEVKDVLRKMYAEELGASSPVAKGRYSTALETSFEALIQKPGNQGEEK
jgi:hypothetical protein